MFRIKAEVSLVSREDDGYSFPLPPMLSRSRVANELLHACRRPVFPVVFGFVCALLASVWGLHAVFGLFVKHSGIRIALFVALASLAYRHSQSAVVRVGFATLILAIMIFVPLQFGERFPFESWKLYSSPAEAIRTVCFLEVTTASGKAFRLDDRVLGDFTTPTNLNRWGEEVVSDMSPEQRQQFARFVVQRTKDYRSERILEKSGWRHWWQMLKFPRHQLSFRWTEGELAELGNPTGIRVRVEEIELDKDHDWAPRVINQKILEVPCF